MWGKVRGKEKRVYSGAINTQDMGYLSRPFDKTLSPKKIAPGEPYTLMGISSRSLRTPMPYLVNI